MIFERAGGGSNRGGALRRLLWDTGTLQAASEEFCEGVESCGMPGPGPGTGPAAECMLSWRACWGTQKSGGADGVGRREV